MTQRVRCQDLPGVLVVCVKRVRYENGSGYKVHTRAPVEGEIDFRPQLDLPGNAGADGPAGAAAGDGAAPPTGSGRAPESAEEPGGRGETEAADPTHASGSAAPPRARPGSTRYRARAVVCHHGQDAAGGHYTCWVRAAAGAGCDGWAHYDDDIVHNRTPTLAAEVHSSAYLIFYERRPGPAAEEEASPDQP